MGLAAETARLVAEFSLDDKKFTAGAKRVTGTLGALEKGVGRVGKGAGQVGAGLTRAGLIIGGAVAGGFTAAAKAGADFEAQLQTINTITRESPENLKAIGEGIRALSRTSGTDIGELTSAYYDLVSAGVDAAHAQDVLKASNTLAIGGLATTAETVNLLTSAINTYGGDARKAASYADMFAVAIERGKVTAAEISESFATVGNVAANSGIEINEIAAAYARLTSQGIPAAEATTQMRSAIVGLTRTTKPLEKLQDATGKNYLKIAGKKGLVPALQQLRTDAAKAGVPLIELLGRIEGVNFTLATTGPNFGKYNADLAAVGNSAGTAAEQMGERQKGLSFAVQKLKTNLIDAGLTLAEGFLPALTRSTTKLTEFLGQKENRDFLTQIGKDIGESIDSIEWDQVLKGARTFVDVLKIAFDYAGRILKIVNALPTEVKAAGLGFLTLNKLSGGLLGAGVGNIAGGIGETLIRSLGAALPGAAGKAFVQPVFVTNWAMMGGGVGGAAGAAAGGGLGVASKVFLVGEAIGLAVAVNEVRNQISTASTAQAQGIQNQTAQFVASQPSKAALENALRGVQTGIHDLEFNPLHVLVQGEALDKLRAMQLSLKTTIAQNPGGSTTALETSKGNLFGPGGLGQSITDSQKAAAEKVTTEVETMKGKIAGELATAKTDITSAQAATKAATATAGTTAANAARQAGYGIEAAVRSSVPTVNTDVRVYVTAAGVSKSVSEQTRYGKANGSAGGGGGDSGVSSSDL